MTKKYQLPLTRIDEMGNAIPLYPINSTDEVIVGKVDSSEELQQPGYSTDETLTETLQHIKLFTERLNSIALETREVSDAIDSESSINIASSNSVNTLREKLEDLSATVDNNGVEIAKRAPIMHAVEDKTYGSATDTLFGHVKLTDKYTVGEDDTIGAAIDGIAASQKALNDAYNALDAAKAPVMHAVEEDTYGLGTSEKYGHLKISDEFQTLIENGEAIAASQKALNDAFTALNGTNKELELNVYSKSPTYHASAEETYGKGDSDLFGHLKVTDEFKEDNAETGASVNGVAASAWALYTAYTELLNSLTTHSNDKATSEKFSHVELTDLYEESQGSANDSVGASSKALADAYASLNKSVEVINKNITVLNSNAAIEDSDIKFNEDGSITTITPNSTKVTTFNEDGSITDVMQVYEDSAKETLIETITVKTTFNDDGSISKKVTEEKVNE